MKRFYLAASLLLVAGCAASYENKIETRLMSYGLSQSVSHCMAERLVRKLSVGQLKTLNDAAHGYRGDPRNMTIRDLSRQISTLGDPRISEVVTRAGIGCAIAG